MRQLLKVVWRRWKVIAEKIGHFQARVLFAVLYFVVVTPFALGVKLFADPLRIKQRDAAPRWTDFQRQTVTLEDARKQF